MKPFRAWSRWAKAGSGCLVLLVLLAVGVAWRIQWSRRTRVRTEHPRRAATLESRVTASGEVRAKEFVDIQSDVAGVITEIAIHEGDTVKKGDVLLRIDPVQSEADNAAMEALARAAEAEVRGQEAQVALARAELARAQQTRERQQRLFDQHLLSPDLRDAADSQAVAARARVAQSEAALQAARMRVEQAEANVRRARDVLGKTVLTAPLDGVVTYLGVEAGERAVPGVLSNPQATLLTIADLANIEVELKVDETDVIGITLGDAAEVTVDALPEQLLPGKVSEIGASPLPSSSLSDDAAKDFKVVVTLAAAPAQLRPGLSASAEIVTDVKEQVLTVPFQALVVREVEVDAAGDVVRPVRREQAEQLPRDRRKEVKGVFVVEDGRARFRPVETGIAGEMDVELVTGLGEDDVVVSGSFRTLRTLEDGDLVRVEEGSATAETG